MQTRSAAQRTGSGKSKAKYAELQEDNTTEAPAGNGVPPAAKKSRNDAAAPKKRRREKPSELCQLNLDVLFLIAAYIHPLDLLNLARTCKSLRELLMDKCSAFVWKTTFQQVKGLPPCPTDLTEPEYANLVFFSRCHGCGKYTNSILWNVRRRYCPGCRIRRLRLLSSCNEIIRKNSVLAVEYITVKKETSKRVDRDQAASFMHNYRQSSDKKQFLSDRERGCKTILMHAGKCEAWQKKRDFERKENIKELQRQRCESIFDRLKQHGYSREINYFGNGHIQQSRESDFRTSRPLTDKEWGRILPEWAKTMSNLRSQRLEYIIYQPRRRALISAYDRFVQNQSPDTPAFDLFPHVADLVRFRPIIDLINAPEETRVDSQSFVSAFAELPGLVGEWKKKLDAELAELVKIPPRLSRNASSSRAVAPDNTRAESSTACLDRLRLATALFRTVYTGLFAYPEVFSAFGVGSNWKYEHELKSDLDHSETISDRLSIQFFAEAPYIIHACGLDPNMATTDDMDHRNARLKCLSCEGPTLVMDWKRAMRHAYSCHQSFPAGAPLSKLPRWQLVGDEYVTAIQSVEQSIEGNLHPSSMRCLLCRHHVGDVKQGTYEYLNHMYHSHSLSMEIGEIKRGVHYAAIGMLGYQPGAVEMVQDGEHVTFRALLK